MNDLWTVILAYLIGAVPTGYLFAKGMGKLDIRQVGSGNIGATNVVRAMGLSSGVLVLLIDAGKALFAIWFAGRISGGSLFWMSASAVAVMVGNAFPVFLNFRGGKAVATYVGAFGYLTPLPTLAIAVLFLITALITRQVSAGSLIGAVTFPLAVWLILHPPAPLLAAAFLAAMLVIWRHKDNIRRLREGSEQKFSFQKGKN